MNEIIETAWIIDDDEIYKYGFRKFVTVKHFCKNILDFANGIEAINYLKSPANKDRIPNVIFLDIDMPVMDGWGFMEAFEKIKPKLHKDITIFMVTSSMNYKDIVRATSNKYITDYISKPIDLHEFTAAFNAGLHKQHA